MIPIEQYANARPIKDFKAWEKTAKMLPQIWQEQVLVYLR